MNFISIIICNLLRLGDKGEGNKNFTTIFNLKGKVERLKLVRMYVEKKFIILYKY